MRGETLWLWIVSVVGFAVIAGALWFAWQSYQNGTAFAAIDPVCKQEPAIQMVAEVQIAGETYTHEVTRRPRHSRYAGASNLMEGSGTCPEAAGTAFVFPLADRSVVLIPAVPCLDAQKALRTEAADLVDVLDICAGPLFLPDLYVIDSLDQPTSWRRVPGGAEGPVKLLSFTARPGRGAPRDGMDETLAALFNTDFRDGDEAEWPEALLSFGRRYDPDFGGAFVARNAEFPWSVLEGDPL